MPPEAFTKQKIDYTCDIWALGCILHEMITGKKLYMEGDDPKSVENTEKHVKHRILHTVPPRLPEIFSRRIRYAVYLMLQKKPLQRPSSEHLLAMDLFKKQGETPDFNL
jgi:serine/threonine protein kinase